MELILKKFINISVSTVWQIRETLEAFNTVKSSLLGIREDYIHHTRVTNPHLIVSICVAECSRLHLISTAQSDR